MMIYFNLFYEFFIIGPLMFGGGLAAIPFLQQMGERTGWYSTVQLMDMIAISEITPGPIGINMATYVGYTVAGIPGGIIATIALILPMIIISLFVAQFMLRFKENTIVQSAFYGLRPASLALIAAAGIVVLQLSLLRIGLWEETGSLIDLFDTKAIALAIILIIVTNLAKKVHPIVFLACSAVIGMVVF